MDEQRLRALASAASIGPWSVHGNNCDEWYVYALHARYETLPGNPSPVKVAWVPWEPSGGRSTSRRTGRKMTAATGRGRIAG